MTKLPKGYRWVRVGEKLRATDQAQTFWSQSWSRMNHYRVGDINISKHTYRRRTTTRARKAKKA